MALHQCGEDCKTATADPPAEGKKDLAHKLNTFYCRFETTRITPITHSSPSSLSTAEILHHYQQLKSHHWILHPLLCHYCCRVTALPEAENQESTNWLQSSHSSLTDPLSCGKSTSNGPPSFWSSRHPPSQDSITTVLPLWHLW